MSVSCDRCVRAPVIYMRYSGQHLCREHFLSILGRRMKRELRAHRAFKEKGRIGIAVSGGKDSILCLQMMHGISSEVKGVELVTITVDEGIAGYRASSLKIASSLAKDLDVPHEIVKFKDLFGMKMDQAVKKRKDIGPCTICGMLRRRALNSSARDLGCSLLVTGHNLDDMAQTVLMNIASADLQRLLRLGPHLDPLPGLVPRVMPLRTTPENETHLAAHLLGLPIHDRECPYSQTARRGAFLDVVLRLEDSTPGTRHSLLQFQTMVAERIKKDQPKVMNCPVCHEPVYGKEDGALCSTCNLLRSLERGSDEEKEA